MAVPVDVAHPVPEPGTELSFPEKFGCSIDSKFYLEGAQVPSNPNKPCELCYCIKNRTSCLIQECTLHIDGCTPIYNKGSCCPVRYNCDHENDILQLEDLSTTTSTTSSTSTTSTTTTTERPSEGFILATTMLPAVATDCLHDSETYADGASITSDNACEHCYCMRGKIVCAVQECEMPMLAGNGHCRATPPAEGECCPSNYVCDDGIETTLADKDTTLAYQEEQTTTVSPVKDIHGTIPEEDLQLQTHIDDVGQGMKDAELATESPDHKSDIKPDESAEGGSGDYQSATEDGIEHEATDNPIIPTVIEQHKQPSEEVSMEQESAVTDASPSVSQETSTSKLETPEEVSAEEVTESVSDEEQSTTKTFTNEPETSKGELEKDDVLEVTTVRSEKPAEEQVTDANISKLPEGAQIGERIDISTEKSEIESDSASATSVSPLEHAEEMTTLRSLMDSRSTTTTPAEEAEKDKIESATAVPQVEKDIPQVPSVDTEKETSEAQEIEAAGTTIKPGFDTELPYETPEKDVIAIKPDLDNKDESVQGADVTTQIPSLSDHAKPDSPTSSSDEKEEEGIKPTLAEGEESSSPEDASEKPFEYATTQKPSEDKGAEELGKPGQGDEELTDQPDATTTSSISSSKVPEESTTLPSTDELPSKGTDKQDADAGQLDDKQSDTTVSPHFVEKEQNTELVQPTSAPLAPITEQHTFEEESEGYLDITTIKTESPDDESLEVQFPANIPGEGDCLVSQKTYTNNSLIPVTNECEIECRCVNSVVICKSIECKVPEDLSKCVLDESRTTSCCPVYKCATEAGEDEDIAATTVRADSKDEEQSTSAPLAEIDLSLVSTQGPMSHVKVEKPEQNIIADQTTVHSEVESDSSSTQIPATVPSHETVNNQKKEGYIASTVAPIGGIATDVVPGEEEKEPVDHIFVVTPEADKQDEVSGAMATEEPKEDNKNYTQDYTTVPPVKEGEKGEVVNAEEVPKGEQEDEYSVTSSPTIETSTERGLETLSPSVEEFTKPSAEISVTTQAPPVHETEEDEGQVQIQEKDEDQINATDLASTDKPTSEDKKYTTPKATSVVEPSEEGSGQPPIDVLPETTTASGLKESEKEGGLDHTVSPAIEDDRMQVTDKTLDHTIVQAIDADKDAISEVETSTVALTDDEHKKESLAPSQVSDEEEVVDDTLLQTISPALQEEELGEGLANTTPSQLAEDKMKPTSKDKVKQPSPETTVSPYAEETKKERATTLTPLVSDEEVGTITPSFVTDDTKLDSDKDDKKPLVPTEEDNVNEIVDEAMSPTTVSTQISEEKDKEQTDAPFVHDSEKESIDDVMEYTTASPADLEVKKKPSEEGIKQENQDVTSAGVEDHTVVPIFEKQPEVRPDQQTETESDNVTSAPIDGDNKPLVPGKPEYVPPLAEESEQAAIDQDTTRTETPIASTPKETLLEEDYIHTEAPSKPDEESIKVLKPTTSAVSVGNEDLEITTTAPELKETKPIDTSTPDVNVNKVGPEDETQTTVVPLPDKDNEGLDKHTDAPSSQEDKEQNINDGVTIIPHTEEDQQTPTTEKPIKSVNDIYLPATVPAVGDDNDIETAEATTISAPPSLGVDNKPADAIPAYITPSEEEYSEKPGYEYEAQTATPSVSQKDKEVEDKTSTESSVHSDSEKDKENVDESSTEASPPTKSEKDKESFDETATQISVPSDSEKDKESLDETVTETSLPTKSEKDKESLDETATATSVPPQSEKDKQNIDETATQISVPSDIEKEKEVLDETATETSQPAKSEKDKESVDETSTSVPSESEEDKPSIDETAIQTSMPSESEKDKEILDETATETSLPTKSEKDKQTVDETATSLPSESEQDKPSIDETASQTSMPSESEKDKEILDETTTETSLPKESEKDKETLDETSTSVPSESEKDKPSIDETATQTSMPSESEKDKEAVDESSSEAYVPTEAEEDQTILDRTTTPISVSSDSETDKENVDSHTTESDKDIEKDNVGITEVPVSEEDHHKTEASTIQPIMEEEHKKPVDPALSHTVNEPPQKTEQGPETEEQTVSPVDEEHDKKDSQADLEHVVSASSTPKPVIETTDEFKKPTLEDSEKPVDSDVPYTTIASVHKEDSDKSTVTTPTPFVSSAADAEKPTDAQSALQGDGEGAVQSTTTAASEIPITDIKMQEVPEVQSITTEDAMIEKDFTEDHGIPVTTLRSVDETAEQTVKPLEDTNATSQKPYVTASLDPVVDGDESIESEEDTSIEEKDKDIALNAAVTTEKTLPMVDDQKEETIDESVKEKPASSGVASVEDLEKLTETPVIADDSSTETPETAAAVTTIRTDQQPSEEDKSSLEETSEPITEAAPTSIETTEKTISLAENDQEKLETPVSGEENFTITTTTHPLFPQHIITTISPIIEDRINVENDTATDQGSSLGTTTTKDFVESETSTQSSTTTQKLDTPITPAAPAAQYPPAPPPIYGQPPQYPSYSEDEYTDEDETEVFGPGTCRYGGKLYVSAQQIPRDDPCDFCFCFRSDIICLQQSCPPPIAGCHEEPINGFCCPRYECPVSMATVLNITTSTTTTSTTLPPHFLHHSYGGAVQRNGCQINGRSYRVGERIESTSGPCINCTCGGDGKMKCDPQACVPEPTMQQVMAVVAASKRR